MAKGSTQKGMRMIGPTPGHRVKQLEVKTRRTGGRYRSQLVEVAIKQPDPATPVHSPRSSPSKHSRSRSHKYFDAWADSAFNGHESMSPPVQQLMLPRKKTQNDYIREWVPWKGEFLKILLELEASPEPRNCTWCGNDGKSHESLPFHRIQQWTGDCYKESALHMTGIWLHLGHGGAPCPHAIAQAQQAAGEPLPMDDQEWEDVEDIEENPKHLCPPAGSRYLTIVDVTGVHFIVVNWCECETAEARYIQLLRAKLFPSMFEKPSTTFTFAVLDDFLRDNLECGTSSMNYYSKLHRITSSVFPHLVPLLKWNGFCGTTRSAEKGGLALFCAACPQPGINVDTNEDLDHWRFTRTVVMDGNFKAEHMHEWKSEDHVLLMDRLGYMVTNPNYTDYLKATPHIAEKSTCNNHRAISQANAAQGKLHATGIGATACAQHGCFYPHCVVDFQKGERQLNMDYCLANALGYNMEGIKQVVCFYNINCSYMTNLRKHEPRPSGSLHGVASWLACGLCLEEAITSLHMDRKDIGEQASELKKLAMAHHADRISSEQSGFITDAVIYLKLHLEAGSNTSASESVQPTAFLDANSEQDYASDDGWLDNVGDELPASDGTLAGPQDKLPLPSALGIDACRA
ncbi:hypothetical protein BKA82DRAFT_33022 [Pisolithus tinctorius]|nr:hypothetical protein BKA82DRAFT_33022 [Pisolithus tinctorius]